MSYAITTKPFPDIVQKLLHDFLARKDIAGKHIMLYSAGVCCRHALELEALRSLNITAIIDQNRDLAGQNIAGIKILSPDSIESGRPDIIAILSIRFHDSIYYELFPKCKTLGIELVDLCGVHPDYKRFPGVSETNFPEGVIISDFLSPDHKRVFRDLKTLLRVNKNPEHVFVCFESDQRLAELTQELREGNIRFFGIGNSNETSWDASPNFEAPQGRCPHVMFKDDQIRQAIILARDICSRFDICSHFDVRDFGNLLQLIRETRQRQGDYVEIGVFRGTSATVAASYMKLTGDRRSIYLLDTFEGFSYSEAQTSSDAVWSGTHTNTSIDFVKNVLKATGMEPHIQKVNICADNLPVEIQAISLVNIDVDLYEAVRDALIKVMPLVVEGGVIICEDYGHTPGLAGANLAVNEFIDKYGENFIKLYFESGQMCLIKIGKGI